MQKSSSEAVRVRINLSVGIGWAPGCRAMSLVPLRKGLGGIEVQVN